MPGKEEKLRRKGRVMVKKEKEAKKEKPEKIDKVWDLVSDLNPY
ncbi:MAG: hypothetical protein ABFD62_04895 [Syntrophaceae bacterium]